MKKTGVCALLAGALFLAGCAGQQVARSSHDPLNLSHPLEGAERLLSPAPHNFRQGVYRQGDPVRRGDRSERFELRHGDCGGSDCKNPRARAEIELTDGLGRDAIGQGIWYGWSFYNQTVPAFSRENSLRLVFGQWTKGGAGQPIMRFIQLGKDEGNFAGCDPKVCDTKSNSTGDLVVQLKDIATQQKWGKAQNDGYVCRIMDMEQNKGRWVDLTVNTNFSAGNDGYLRIWVNGEQVCDYTGPMVSAETVRQRRDIRHRRGIYSSWTKRWEKAEGGAPHPDLIVYYDEFRSGPRKNDVDVAFREARSEHPTD